jgi:hypothetical protein
VGNFIVVSDFAILYRKEEFESQIKPDEMMDVRSHVWVFCFVFLLLELTFGCMKSVKKI